MSSHYAALLSLKHTIERIKCLIEVSVLPWFPLDSLYENVLSLQDFLIAFHYSDWNDLYEELREVICRMEDVLEFQKKSVHLLSASEKVPIDICKVEQEMDLFCGRINEIKECLSRNFALYVPPPPPPIPSIRWFPAKESSAQRLVGMQHEQEELRHQLFGYDEQPIKITGMAGIGKTALAKVDCEDAQVWNRFECHIFVPVGPNRPWREILLCVLSQLDYRGDDSDDDEALEKCVFNTLKGRTCLFLLDDVWDENIMASSAVFIEKGTSSELFLENIRTGLELFLDDKWIGSELFSRNHGIRMIITTRNSCRRGLKMRFLDKEESWGLLCRKVFATDSCPYELKKLGKKIAEKCEGLPLAINSVANHLAKADKTVEYWESVAEEGIASIICADDEVLKVLHPSYQHLPLHLKPYFLYLGVYPQCFEISVPKIVKLWIAEGFLEIKVSKDDAGRYLLMIEHHNIVIVKRRRLLRNSMIIKTCSLHIVYWCYCKIQAQKEKLFQILTTVDDLEGTKSQRRLCIHNNTLFGIKDFHKSVAGVSKNLRSLLCTGPYHKFPVSISSGLKLLKVLDAVAIRFFEFPFEVINLILLRYLAITYDGHLPGTISRLVSLEFLIVRRHVRIIDPRCPSYMPEEIWKMKELRHLQVVGSDLPEPTLYGDELPNLRTLLDVTPQSCTFIVLKKIPNLRKLGVQIVVPAVDVTEDSLKHLNKLYGLKSLKCAIVNPKPSSPIAIRTFPASIFPKGLEKLDLSGFGYSWDQMSTIAGLEKLEVLKLRHCAFLGRTWAVREGEFRNLEFLLLEDIDLRYWRTDRSTFDSLRHLIIRHCYNLEPFDICMVLKAIEIVDCKPCVVDCAMTYSNSMTWKPIIISVVSSWEDGKDVK